MLILQDPVGEPLDGLLGEPMELNRFLRLAVSLAAALGKLHQQGLIQKDIKPANMLVNSATGRSGLPASVLLPVSRANASLPSLPR